MPDITNIKINDQTYSLGAPPPTSIEIQALTFEKNLDNITTPGIYASDYSEIYTNTPVVDHITGCNDSIFYLIVLQLPSIVGNSQNTAAYMQIYISNIQYLGQGSSDDTEIALSMDGGIAFRWQDNAHVFDRNGWTPWTNNLSSTMLQSSYYLNGSGQRVVITPAGKTRTGAAYNNLARLLMINDDREYESHGSRSRAGGYLDMYIRKENETPILKVTSQNNEVSDTVLTQSSIFVTELKGDGITVPAYTIVDQTIETGPPNKTDTNQNFIWPIQIQPRDGVCPFTYQYNNSTGTLTIWWINNYNDPFSCTYVSVFMLCTTDSNFSVF